MVRAFFPLALALSLTACGQDRGDAAMGQANAAPPTPSGPIVVELFQSQGCSSCPPANAAFNAVAGRSDLIALSFSVTYWDHLGWKDPFAKTAFTQRQRDYAKTLSVGAGVYTPQFVINGANGLVGVRDGELGRAIAAARPLTRGPAINATAKSVTIAKGAGRATVWLARYDPAERRVAVGAGENGGRTLPHRNIVRELTAIGQWSGVAADLPVPAAREKGLRGAILVQDNANGKIIAAARLPAA